MGRPSQPVEDTTPLDGERIDVGARIGWLLRSSREAAGVGLGEMRARVAHHDVDVSLSSLSRIEHGQWRRSDLIAAYEAELGLEPGRLQGPVDILCRTFPYGPGDEDAAPSTHQALTWYDEAVRAAHGPQPTGIEWLRLARSMDPGRGFGLPTEVLRPLVERLTSELARGVGTAFATRYEALARLRCGKYGHLVADVATAFLREPGVQLVGDVAGCLSERPSASLVAWAAAQLDHPADMSMRAAATVLENVANAGTLPPSDWMSVPEGFIRAYDAAVRGGDEGRRVRLDRTYATLPRTVRDAIRQGPHQPRGIRAPSGWARLRSNRHFTIAADLAAELSIGREQPMLTRLMFEMLYDFRPARSFNAALLASTSPVSADLIRVLMRAAESHPDASTRHGAMVALCMSLRAESRPDVIPWLSSSDPDLCVNALLVAGMCGVDLPGDVLDRLLANPGHRRWLLWYAGMAAPGHIVDWGTDRRLGSDLDVASAWWLRHGPRVTDQAVTEMAPAS